MNEPTSYGPLLRSLRLGAGLTQETLADRAKMSVEAISAHERGKHTRPYRDTVLRLADALQLTPAKREQLEAAARSAAPRGPRSAERASTTAAEPQTAPKTPHNLPEALPELIGRDGVVAELNGILPTKRHVTLAGTGGIGKTSIALAVGASHLSNFADGVWCVDLAGLGDPRLAVGQVAAVVGAREESSRPLSDIVVESLRRRHLLLVLDNCEHVIAEIAPLTEAILLACPKVSLLATSRQPLMTPREYIYDVSPLSFPTDGEVPSPKDALLFGAVALFVDRAIAADRTFELTAENVSPVVEICRRVHGLALGIELAAARAKQLGLASIVRRLDQQLKLLAGGIRSAPRHQTLRALIDWSHNLFSQPERVVFRRLAIFAGSWSLEAAETVCASDEIEPAVAPVLADLVSKSQVVAEQRFGEMRFRLLDSVREYALEKLEASGERAEVALRHAQWVAAFADEVMDETWSLPRRQWLTRVMPEVDNARAALLWCLDHAAMASTAARIAIGLGNYLYYRGAAGEGLRWLKAALMANEGGVDRETEGALWLAISVLSAGTSRVNASEQAIRCFGRVGESRNLARAYLNLAVGHRQNTDFAKTKVAAEKTLDLLRGIQQARTQYYAATLGWLASAFIGLGEFDEARVLFEEAIRLYEDLEDEDRAAVERLNFAELEAAAGNVPRALGLVEQAIEGLQAASITGAFGTDLAQVAPHLNAAGYLLLLGEITKAAETARAALALARGVQYPLYTAIAIQHLAVAIAAGGDAPLAARLLGFVDVVFRNEGVGREPTESALCAMLLDRLRLTLGEDEIVRLRREGSRLSEAWCVKHALAAASGDQK